jgi:hypothetical protein
MKSKIIMNSTTNRGEFNRAYKFYLEHKGKIHCCVCRYNRCENDKRKWYGSNRKDIIKYPNWKLVSKNPKQWMEKPITLVEKSHGYGRWKKTYISIIF